MTYTLNSAVNKTLNLIVANDTITDIVVFFNGEVSTLPIAHSSTGISGFIRLTFTPTETGMYTVFVNAEPFAFINVETLTFAEALQNIEDEALGSWQWNKTTGILNMLRQNGEELATFRVVDNLEESSRERL
jgi:hypothetical protein